MAAVDGDIPSWIRDFLATHDPADPPPVVILTNRPSTDDAVTALRAGILDVVDRTLEPDDGLLSRLKAARNHYLEFDNARSKLKKLQDDETLLRTITETLAAAVFIIQGDRFQFMNLAGERITGRSQEELARIQFWDLVHPEYREMVRGRGLARQRGEAVPSRYEFPIVRLDGEVRWVDFTASFLEYQGRPAMLGTAFDITTRHEALTALRESEARFRSLSENAPDIIYTTDPKGRLTWANPAWRALLGHSPENVIGLTLLDFTPSSQHEALVQLFKSIRDQGRAVPTFAVTLTHQDGTPRRFQVSGGPNFDVEGRFLGAVGLLRDVTQLEQLEERVRQHRKVKDLATLASGVAHEFNNILMVIQGYTQILSLSGQTGPDVNHILGKIEDGTRRAGVLTRKMISFARLETGERVPVDLALLVDETAAMLRRTLPRGIHLELDLEPGVPLVDANPSQMEQVLLHLVFNARDAMPRGGRVTIGVRSRSWTEADCRGRAWASPGPWVELWVGDTGRGMTAEEAARVYDPLFTTKAMGQGTGLGLPVTASIVKNHQGGLDFVTQPGQGTTFSVFLPALREVPVPAAPPAPSTPYPQGNGQIVLVVDDEETVREVIRSALETFGYQVEEAPHGEAALRLYDQARNQGRPFHLVVLDLAMPVMDGRTCYHELLKRDPNARILIATGHGGDRYQLLGDFPQAKALLQKPFDLKDLLTAVANTLEEGLEPIPK